MKILAFCDTHSSAKAIDKLVELAKKADVIVCAGDLSTFSDKLRENIAKFDIGKPFIIIPGNHEEGDLDSAIKELDFVKNIHKKTLIIDDVLFLGCGGGGFSRYFTIFDKAAKEFKTAMQKHKGKVVLVTHAPPYKTKLDEMGLYDVGAEPIKKFIEDSQPDLAICGHIHENAGKEDKVKKTRIVNPGPKGMLLQI